MVSKPGASPATEHCDSSQLIMSSLSVNSELVFYITGKKVCFHYRYCNDGQLIFLFLLSTNTEHQNLNILLSFFLGNLCRCTGYRWIIDGFKTFCDVRTISGELFRMDNVLPLDPTQDLIFPPELLQKTEQVFFQGEKVRWISPADLKDLIKLKAEYPNAPLLVGNTTIRTVHPLVIYVNPTTLLYLGVNLRAGCSLSILNDVLLRGIEKLGPEKSKVYQALVQTLQCLVGKQIRNMSVSKKTNCCKELRGTDGLENLKFIFGLYLYIISYNILIVIFKLLVEGTQLLEEEISVPPTAPGGREEYHKSLVLRFFFKLYTQVLLELQQKVGMHDIGPVGRPNVHQAALQQTTGEAVYYDDLPAVKGELFVSVVTSTMVHAKIISIDAPVALATSGVITFISAKDVPGQNRRLWFNNPEELFAEKEVICVGQIIGTIVAETREQAKRVAEKILHNGVPNKIIFAPKRKLERGNEEEGFEKADHILKGELYMGGQEHFYMETQGLIAIPKGEAGEMEPYVASQHAAFTQEVVGITLGIDSNKITCHVKRLGGGFGVKVMKIGSLSAITATATYKTSRAVRCVLERGDDMLFTSGSNGGCTLDESSFLILIIRNCKLDLPSYTAFHGFGGPQELTNIESVLHEVAARCGLPAHLVRDINMYKDEKCYTHHKQLFSPHDMVQCWNECLEKSDYTHRCLSIEQFNAHNHWKKRGISTIPLKFRIGFSKGFYNQVVWFT
uniref:Aldehyde oxidase 5 n=1 Tax=Cyprinus carpio TaxID=7962 RepID=A0A8C1UXR7_CYPCA